MLNLLRSRLGVQCQLPWWFCQVDILGHLRSWPFPLTSTHAQSIIRYMDAKQPITSSESLDWQIRSSTNPHPLNKLTLRATVDVYLDVHLPVCSTYSKCDFVGDLVLFPYKPTDNAQCCLLSKYDIVTGKIWFSNIILIHLMHKYYISWTTWENYFEMLSNRIIKATVSLSFLQQNSFSAVVSGWRVCAPTASQWQECPTLQV